MRSAHPAAEAPSPAVHALVARHTCPQCQHLMQDRARGRCPHCQIELFVGKRERLHMGLTGFWWDADAARWRPARP